MPDISVGTCRYYEAGSFNVRPYDECVEKYDDGTRKFGSRWNNQQECEANGGQWIAFYNYLEKATGTSLQGL